MNYRSGLSSDSNRLLVLGCSAVGALGTVYLGYRLFSRCARRKHLQQLITQKCIERDRGIAECKQRLFPNVLGENRSKLERKFGEITSLNFEDLRHRLQVGQLSAVEVLQAYQFKALEAHSKTNCICEFLPEAAGWAADLDARYGSADSTESKPPLFGIPVSLKESHKLVGHESTVGFAQFLGQKCDVDATMAAVLRRLGAVPFVTTNIPQSMLSVGSSNPVYGVTTNPRDPRRSSGGSSSGEGALIGFGGSPLGVGTDVGGSVRVPAHWCGICSLKPTVNRLAQGGRRGAMPGLTGVKGTCGPMGMDVDSLAWFMRTVCGSASAMYDLDPYVSPHLFDEKLYSSNTALVIGYYEDDGWMSAVPSCRRAVAVARSYLESKGHRLVPLRLPFTTSEMHELVSCYTAAIIPDSGQLLAYLCSNDIVDPYHADLMKFFSFSPTVQGLAAHWLIRSRRLRSIYGGLAKTTSQQRIAFEKIDVFKAKFLAFWQQNALDALICPACASTPLPADQAAKLFVSLWMYTALYNLLDFPAGIVPCTLVTEKDEVDLKNQVYKDEDWVCREIRRNALGSVGLPVGVQCVSLPFREEVCLRVMRDIETVAKAGKIK